MTGAGRIALAALFSAAVAGAAAAQDAPRLSLPLRCDAADECAVIKLMDHAPGPEMRDYGCGDFTGRENDYPGTSIAVRDMKRMAEGVPVLAAAAGSVVRIRDGMADAGAFDAAARAAMAPVGCGNMALLNHGNGWTTAYCHMRNGSLTVKEGDAVKAGDKIGEVGLSGLTELPHLHFQVRRNDQPVDPFTGPDPRPGACGVQPGRLWTATALNTLGPYAPSLVRAAGFAAREADLRSAREGAYAAPLPACPAGLRLWAEIIGVKKGDQLMLRIDGPNGSPLTVQRATFDRDYAQAFPQTAPFRAMVPGDYVGMVELWRGAKLFSRRVKGTVPGGC